MPDASEIQGGSGGETCSKRHFQDVRVALSRGYIDLKRAAELLPASMLGLLQNGKPRTKVSAARVLVQMIGQDQADDHQNRKDARMDQGLATERIAAVQVDYGDQPCPLPPPPTTPELPSDPASDLRTEP